MRNKKMTKEDLDKITYEFYMSLVELGVNPKSIDVIVDTKTLKEIEGTMPVGRGINVSTDGPLEIGGYFGCCKLSIKD